LQITIFLALLVFAFAIVAVLIALCGHHWQTSWKQISEIQFQPFFSAFKRPRLAIRFTVLSRHRSSIFSLLKKNPFCPFHFQKNCQFCEFQFKKNVHFNFYEFNYFNFKFRWKKTSQFCVTKKNTSTSFLSLYVRSFAWD